MKKFTYLLFCLILGIGLATAQTTKVTGTVISADDNLPIIGASIVAKGTMVGTVTDIDGVFHLDVPSSARTLVISYVGMKPQEVEVKPNMKVVMESDNQVLDEVMVVAYGTTKKESFTGSAEVVKADKIAARPVANVTKALEGQVAGAQMTSGSGQPGSGASIMIRGYGSINATANPLYVVDGVPYDGNISAINPNDIESITVLKDASAGALYGSRGANGVVMVTTKKGKEGKTSVELKANWGIASRALPRYETMNEEDFLETIFFNFRNAGMFKNGMSAADAGAYALTQLSTGRDGVLGKNEEFNPYNYAIADLIDPITGQVRSDAVLKYSENWLDEATAQNPLRQEYQLSVTSGNDKTKAMYSLGYLSEDGLLKTTNFKRFSGRANVDTEITEWFKGGLNVNYSRNESNSAQENNSTTSNVWYSAQLMGPIYPIYTKNTDGTTVLDGNGKPVFDYSPNRPSGANSNWNMIATLYDDKYATESDNLSGRTYITLGDLQEGTLQGLKFTTTFGMDLINTRGMSYYNPFNGNSAGVKGSLSKDSRRTFSYTLNEVLSYDRKFGDHHIDALVGHEFYQYKYEFMDAYKTGFPFGGLFELNAAINTVSAGSYMNDYAIQSVFSRLNYDYADKYYFSVSYRTDGSSRFYKDNRWGNFWSIGGNWRISHEEFMKDLEWVNNLSLKASYGVQGNDAVGSLYAWQRLYDFNHNANYGGATISTLENKELKWEKNGNLNLGLEFRLFDRFNGSIEWYNRKTTDMLMEFPMAVSTGFDSYYANVGSMRNQGWDISLSYDFFRTKDFDWKMTLIGSTVKNKVLKLADKPEIISGSYIIKEGETLNSFYTATAAGVDPLTGLQMYEVWDENENGERTYYKTTSASKATSCKSIQGSRIPALYGSIGNDFRYKNFDLSFMFTYSIGGKILDSVYNTLMYSNYIGQARHQHLDRAWKNPGDVTDIERVDISKTHVTTDNDLIDASYFAMKNVTLGYTLPSDWLKKIKFNSVRLTATADNLFMLTHMKGMNPQYNFSGGTNFGYVPTRTVSLGIDVKF